MKKFFNDMFKKKQDDDEDPLSAIIKNHEKIITAYEKKMILNIVKLSNITVKDIMVPRVDVVCINKNIAIKEIIQIVDKEGKSRLPVFDDNFDNIVGILHAKDLLKYFTYETEVDISKLIREAFFVPESKQIGNLLVEMREKKNHLAIVVDEYGGFSGIVCLEDIIERIVGEIQDEFDDEVDDVIEIGENKYIINARISLEDLNSRLKTEIEDQEIDTLGGLIYMLFGKIPLKNEKVRFKNYLFTIENISGRKIEKIKLEILGEENENEK